MTATGGFIAILVHPDQLPTTCTFINYWCFTGLLLVTATGLRLLDYSEITTFVASLYHDQLPTIFISGFIITLILQLVQTN